MHGSVMREISGRADHFAERYFFGITHVGLDDEAREGFDSGGVGHFREFAHGSVVVEDSDGAPLTSTNIS